MEIAIALIIGFILGRMIPRKTNGVLRIDRRNPAKDIYRFDVDDLDGLANKRRIVLRVDPNANLSQK